MSDILNSAAATKTYTQTGLTHNVLYNFQVRGRQRHRRRYAESTTGRPVAGKPGAPTLTSTGGDKQVTLTWTKNADGRWVDKWQYQYKTTGSYGSWTDVPSSGDSTRSYTLTTGLNNGRTYTFKVRGVNAAGNGTESSAVSVSTQPAKPPASPQPPRRARRRSSCSPKAG